MARTSIKKPPLPSDSDRSGRALLAEILQRKLNVTFQQAYEWVDFIIEQVIQALENHQTVKIQGFGVFEVYRRKGRRIRHPGHGAQVQLPDMWWVRFRPAKNLKYLNLAQREDA